MEPEKITKNEVDIKNLNEYVRIYDEQDEIIYLKENEETGQSTYIKQFKNEDAQLNEVVDVYRHYNLLDISNKANIETIKEAENTTSIVFKNIEGKLLSDVNLLNSLSNIQAIHITQALIQYIKKSHRLSCRSHTLRPDHIFYDAVKNKLTIIPVLFRSQNKTEKKFINNSYQCLYLSPEEINDTTQFIDWRSDYYKSGMIFYELVNKIKAVDLSSVNLQGVRKFHLNSKNLSFKSENNYQDTILNYILSRLTKVDANLRYFNEKEILQDLSYLEACINKQEDKLPSLMQHRINNYIYPRAFYKNAFEKIDLIKSNNLSNVIVSGYSGYGKSEFINAIGMKCESSGVVFLKGKFERYDTGSAFMAIKQALSGLKSVSNKCAIKNRLNDFKKFVSDGVFNSIRLLFQDVFDYYEVNGNNKSDNVLNNEKIFHRYVCLFLEKLTKNEQHVFVSLDDIQWCDRESKNLIMHVLENRPKCLHFVFSYRINEIDDNKYAKSILEFFNEDKFSYEEKINGFSDGECNDYVNNFIGLVSNKGFSTDVNRRSQGAPFFIKQILTSMENEKSTSLSRFFLNYENKKITEEYKSLEFYIQRNLNNIDSKVFEFLKYLSCFAKPLEVEVLECIFDMSKDDILSVLNVDKHFEYIRNAPNVFCITHDKVTETVYESIPLDERSKIHRDIAYALLKLKKHGYAPDAAIQLNLSKLILSDDEIKDAFRLNVEAGSYSLSQFAYDASNMFFCNALDLISAHENLFDVGVKSEVQYGYVYTAFLSGKSVGALDDIEELLESNNNIIEVSKYYALFKDVIVNSNESYSKATEKGVELLSRFNINIPSSRYEIDELVASVNDSDAMSVCANKLAGMKKGDDVYFEEKYQMRILLDLWEAAYYSQNNNIMTASLYKIVDLTIKRNVCSESSFGFSLYAMYLSKHSEYELAYQSGLLALKIVEVFEDEIMYPKITNLFCNYSDFYTEKFSAVSDRYYSSYQASVNTSDFLFGAWAVYFHLWTKFLSGDVLTNIFERAAEMFPFLEKTNDKKMILSFLVICDSISSLVGENIELVGVDKNVYFDGVDNELSYFNEINFPQGSAWKSILDCMNNYLFGNYGDVIESVDKYISKTNIDAVMFPLAQIYFFESLSIIQILSGNELHELNESDLRDRLNVSVNHLAELSGNKSTNFNAQYNVVKLALLLNEKPLDDCQDEAKPLIKVVNEFGNYLEKGILFELLAQHEISKNNIKIAADYIFKSMQEFDAWGAKIKKKQLQYIYLSILNNGSIGSLILQEAPCDLAKLMKATKSITNYIDPDVFVSSVVDVVAKESTANKVSFISYFDRKFKMICNHIKGETKLVPPSKQKYASQFIHNDVIEYCYKTKTSVLLNDSNSDVSFMRDAYVLNNDVKSVVCVPVIGYGRVLAIMYLESFKGSVDFTVESFYFIKEFMSHMSLHFINAMKFNCLKFQSDHINNDMMELKKQMEVINLSQKYSNSGVWQWDVLSGAVDWSDEIFNIFGCSKSETEVNYNSFLSVIHPDDRIKVEQAIQKCFDGAEYEIEHRIIRPDGSIRWLSGKGNVIRDSDNKPVRMFGIAQDITLRKEVDQANKDLSLQLSQSQKMESIGNLTGGIAHDFNNILASMLGYTELTKAKVSSIKDTKVMEYLDNIYTAGQRAKDLVAQMSLFSRTHKHQEEPISLAPIVKESIKLLSSTIPSGIKISSFIDDDIPDVIADPIQAQQILINLCVNSRDAIGDLGNISISLQTTYQSTKCDACHESFHGDFVNLTIEDNGSGIDPLILPKIFDPFFTTKEVGKGTGMGMSVVHGIVHSCHGHILIRSSYNGTKINILFPLAENTKKSVVVTKASSPEHLTIKGNIVIVDDEELIVGFTKELLSLHGATVTTFNRGADALNYILTHRDEIDLLITDMTMPEMSGGTLSENILKEIPEFPIILCSGYYAEMDKKMSKATGIRKYLIKPVETSELLEVVSEILGSK